MQLPVLAHVRKLHSEYESHYTTNQHALLHTCVGKTLKGRKGSLWRSKSTNMLKVWVRVHMKRQSVGREVCLQHRQGLWIQEWACLY